jgi:pimeloyl-ACP methyl ester carboxylesterase
MKDARRTLLDECKQHVQLHARVLRLDDDEVAGALARIESIEGEGLRSWGGEFMACASSTMCRHENDAALAYLNLAMFPYSGIADRPEHQRRLRLFESMQAADPTLGRTVDLTIDGRPVRCLVRRHAAAGAPMLVVMGGIVSSKEQWSSFLKLGPRLGCSVAVLDFPGAGDNGLTYGPDSPRHMTSVFDALAAHMPADRILCVAMSFAGHLLMKTSLIDPRIAAIATVGAPVRMFFEDERWWQEVPELTKVTLARLARVSPAAVFAHLSRFALSHAELGRVDAAVEYVCSRHDDVIPTREADLIAADVPHANILRLDDVHGAPHHLPLVRVFVLHALLRALNGMGRGRPLLHAGVSLAERVLRATAD